MAGAGVALMAAAVVAARPTPVVCIVFLLMVSTSELVSGQHCTVTILLPDITFVEYGYSARASQEPSCNTVFRNLANMEFTVEVLQADGSSFLGARAIPVSDYYVPWCYIRASNRVPGIRCVPESAHSIGVMYTKISQAQPAQPGRVIHVDNRDIKQQNQDVSRRILSNHQLKVTHLSSQQTITYVFKAPPPPSPEPSTTLPTPPTSTEVPSTSIQVPSTPPTSSPVQPLSSVQPPSS
eukprot:scpid95247/ scgid4240/ 